ncbi:CHAD domain-containing protein [Desulfopila sp. IMCC35008]|uniref:CHAD domain-containing protein n=1 Tax=Desulfopila sp. IMCC35008 TaxID=2653858 RepID=UPI0013D3D251|nr:CHAD domain-containing protein [Desulfopila sp. IMCC35008]
MADTRIFLVPADFETEPLFEKIGALYLLEEVGAEEGRYSCLDTYDWRLFQKGHCLCRKRATYSLEDGVGREIAKGNGSRKNYPFWWDLETGELQNILQPVMEVRALQEQFGMDRVTEQFQLLNKDEKIVLRLILVRSRISRQGHDQSFDLQNILMVEPLRGYPKPMRSICGLLNDIGLVEWDSGSTYVEEALALYGVDPQVTNSKFEVSLDSQETVDEVVRDICLQLRETMLQTLPGIHEDIDSEFLHDLRVAIRRTRSLLSLLKKYLDVEGLQFYRDELKWLGNITGPTRDLDVYLLAKDEFRKMLPLLLHPGLDNFFNDLEIRRKKSIRALRRNLASERFAVFMEKWKQFLEELPENNLNPAGKKTCRMVARKIIRKRFTKILRDGGHISPESPDKSLHALRIEGKKFRYLLEFFRSLFVRDAVDKYHKQLKRLQNNLGDFNDLSVQAEMLATQMELLSADDDKAIQAGAALGGLIVHLRDRQKQVREKFEKTFERFASLENIELLESIFAEPDEETAKGGPK